MADTKNAQSPLDDIRYFSGVKALLEKGAKPSEIVEHLAQQGVITTTDSIRRFKQRHGIEVAGQSPTKKTAKKAVVKKAVKQPKIKAKKVMHKIIKDEETGEQCIMVFVPGKDPRVAASTHPHYAEIVKGAKAGDESVFDLFDIGETISQEFARLSERVFVRGGKVFFDGEEQDEVITDHILRVHSEDGDYGALVNFYEKIATNSTQHSREQLYRWLRSDVFSITEDGDVIAYKGFKLADDGTYLSNHAGHAIVDGVEINGVVPQKDGSIVEMPRSEVTHNPAASCSSGLHVGTFAYAKMYGKVTKVLVNPRDFVSVPNGEGEKARTCRYRVVGPADEQYDKAVVSLAELGD